MNNYIFYAEIAIAIIMVVLIAVQQRGTALGAGFGGSGEFYAAKRGIQKKIFYATIVVAVIFLILNIVGLFFA